MKRKIPEIKKESAPQSLDEYQDRRLRVTFEYIDALLEEIEDMLDGSAIRRVFPRIISDIPPSRHPLIEDQIALIRQQLLEVLEKQGVSRSAPYLPASRTTASHCTTIHIALEELKPRAPKGGEEQSPPGADTLTADICMLQELVAQLGKHVEERDQDTSSD